jgi:hypothetical protein
MEGIPSRHSLTNVAADKEVSRMRLLRATGVFYLCLGPAMLPQFNALLYSNSFAR